MAVPTTSLPKEGNTSDRYAKWMRAGRPKMDEWVKSGAGIGGPSSFKNVQSSPFKGVQSSGLLQKRLKAEPTSGGKQKLMDRYDEWLGAGRPKMADWQKRLSGAAKNRLTR